MKFCGTFTRKIKLIESKTVMEVASGQKLENKQTTKFLIETYEMYSDMFN